MYQVEPIIVLFKIKRFIIRRKLFDLFNNLNINGSNGTVQSIFVMLLLGCHDTQLVKLKVGKGTGKSICLSQESKSIMDILGQIYPCGTHNFPQRLRSCTHTGWMWKDHTNNGL